MLNRTKYNEILEKIEDISKHHANQEIQQMSNDFRNMRDNFEMNLLFVGHYNAGKSSLINGLLGRPEFLREATEPTTTLATEISYAEEESGTAYRINGESEKIEPGKVYSSEEYQCLKYCLHADGLKAVSEFTIVDTPGSDSGIEAHNRALKNYIGKGAAYLVVIDQAKGGLDDPTRKLILEISQYSSHIALLITHCDLLDKEDAEKIRLSAEMTLRSCGLVYPVWLVSKYDPDVQTKLIRIISNLNAQEAFDQELGRFIRGRLADLKLLLCDMKENLYLDSYDDNQKIRQCQRDLESLNAAFAVKKQEELGRVDSMTDKVIAEVKEALRAQATAIARSFVNGNIRTMQEQIVDTIRPVLIRSAKTVSVQNIESVTNGLTLDKEGTHDSVLLNTTLVQAKELKECIEKGSFLASDRQDRITSERSEVGKQWYHLIMGAGAILTDFVAPWLEIIIVALPEIGSLLRLATGDTDLARAELQFKNEIVPQIGNRLYPQIRESIEQNLEAVVQRLEESVKMRQDSLKLNLEQAVATKNQKETDFKNYCACVDEDIQTITHLMEKESKNEEL